MCTPMSYTGSAPALGPGIQGNIAGAWSRKPPGTLIANALEQLASIDLIELCKEARIEHCRATRDLSSCGRHVLHVLTSCGHASLCAECRQRCDVCPICRSPINGARLRLYQKCVEAGLISKRHDERFQEKEDYGNPVNTDVQRLHSLFDVALQNNLTSLICHYVTDVCLDENAVSSDPLLAFLLDEVVIKDWCKRTVNALISEIGTIYRSGLEMMESKLSQLQKFAAQLAGIYSVLEVMIASFTEAVSAHVNDLHQLIENALKAKQHSEAMIWCIRHRFLQDIRSRYTDYTSWSSDVIQRKASAEARKWPEFFDKGSGDNEANQGTLFIEQALQNLGIEQSYRSEEEEVQIKCLQDEQSSSMFCSTITADHFSLNSYPFKNLREAVDVLFLHGASDMVIAKQAILLYYLFDRHWTRPDSEWRYLVDDFAATFGITNRTLLECLVFCLLDDHSSEALEEACSLLPKISSKEAHPKIAQVLLERQRPDMALVVLKCTGRDSFSATENIEKDVISSLSEAVTAVRVRIEHGHLTEAFMYHRSYCSRVKEQQAADMKHADHALGSSWISHVERMMMEFCTICIERNLVDKIIDLPWDSEEEKYLHKSLFDYAHETPTNACGSLLVVYYLRRYRYLEAYEVDRSLQRFEQKKLESTTEEIASKIRQIAQWRGNLVVKCLDMLPEVQRENVKAINSGEQSQFARTAQVSSPVNQVVKSPSPVIELSSSFTPVLQNKSSHHSKNINVSTHSGGLIRSNLSEFDKKVQSVLQPRAVPQGTPAFNMRSAGGIFPSVSQNGDSPFFTGAKDISSRKGEAGFKKGIKPVDDGLPMFSNLSSDDTPMKDYRTSLLNTEVNKTTPFRGKDSVGKGEFRFGSRAEKPFILNGTGLSQNGLPKVSGNAGFREDYKLPTENILSSNKKSSVDGAAGSKGVSRWRSDESSEDEGDRTNRESGASLVTRRRPRFSRR